MFLNRNKAFHAIAVITSLALLLADFYFPSFIALCIAMWAVIVSAMLAHEERIGGQK